MLPTRCGPGAALTKAGRQGVPPELKVLLTQPGLLVFRPLWVPHAAGGVQIKCQEGGAGVGRLESGWIVLGRDGGGQPYRGGSRTCASGLSGT